MEELYQVLLSRFTHLKVQGRFFQKARILLLLSRKNEDLGDLGEHYE